MTSPYVRNIALDLVLTLITCGLFNFYVQYCQMEAVNVMLKENRYSYWRWLLLTLITCGLYHFYHEYRKSEDIANLVRRDTGTDGLVSLALCILGFFFVADAIQQAHINRYFGSNDL